jgi:hypothetical protein
MSYKHPARRRCERLYTTSKTVSKRLVTPGGMVSVQALIKGVSRGADRSLSRRVSQEKATLGVLPPNPVNTESI